MGRLRAERQLKELVPRAVVFALEPVWEYMSGTQQLLLYGLRWNVLLLRLQYRYIYLPMIHDTTTACLTPSDVASAISAACEKSDLKHVRGNFVGNFFWKLFFGSASRNDAYILIRIYRTLDRKRFRLRRGPPAHLHVLYTWYIILSIV